MKFYEIEEQILTCVDEETGEIIDEAKLEALEMARDEKIESIACWIKELKADAEAIKAEKMALAKRQSAKENKAESLERFLANYLGFQRFETAKAAISFRRSESVEIADDAIVPEEYHKITVSYDKTALKKALKDGQQFIGVDLVEKQNIQIK